MTMNILHCNNTARLAKQISDQIDLKVINRVIDKFSDGELNIKINDDLYQKDVLITHELFPNINELLVHLFDINHHLFLY